MKNAVAPERSPWHGYDVTHGEDARAFDNGAGEWCSEHRLLCRMHGGRSIAMSAAANVAAPGIAPEMIHGVFDSQEGGAHVEWALIA